MTAQLLVGDIFANAARAVPDRPAAARGDAQLTFAQLDRRANRVARRLRAMGIGHGDRVVVWSDTSLDTLPFFVALAKLGAVFAPIGTMLGADEAFDMLTVARPSMLAVDAERRADGTALQRGPASPSSSSPAWPTAMAMTRPRSTRARSTSRRCARPTPM